MICNFYRIFRALKIWLKNDSSLKIHVAWKHFIGSVIKKMCQHLGTTKNSDDTIVIKSI